MHTTPSRPARRNRSWPDWLIPAVLGLLSAVPTFSGCKRNSTTEVREGGVAGAYGGDGTASGGAGGAAGTDATSGAGGADAQAGPDALGTDEVGMPNLDQLDCNQLGNAAINYWGLASRCVPQVPDPCRILTGADPCGCAIAVSDPDSAETRQYLAVVAAQKKKGCDARCARMTCPPAVRATCQRLPQQDHANCQVLPG